MADEYTEAVDERQRALREAQLKEREIDQMYFDVFTTEQGKNVLKHLESQGFMDRTIYTAPQVGLPIDPILSAMNEGQRIFCIRIRHRILRATLPLPEVQQQRAHSKSLEQ